MSRYSFELLPEAEDQLAEAWQRAADKNAVTEAAALIERTLAQDPFRWSVELSEGLHRLVIEPLVAYFEVDSLMMIVTAKSIKLLPGH